MANKRDLKKDINYLTYELVSDCYIYIHLFPGKNTDEVAKIIGDSLSLRSELIKRVNNPGGNEKKDVRLHYTKIREDLLSGVDQSFKSLSTLTKKQ